MQLIYLDLETDRPKFIEDPTFNVIPNIEDFLDVDFDFLDEEEVDKVYLSGDLNGGGSLELWAWHDGFRLAVIASRLRPKTILFSDVIATENDQKALQVQHSETRLDIGVQSGFGARCFIVFSILVTGNILSEIHNKIRSRLLQ